MASKTYIVAFYEIDRAYGGPEEGGWWFDTGNLVRTFKVTKNLKEAHSAAARANRVLQNTQKGKDVSSIAYSGGKHVAMVFEDHSPAYFPESRPTYC